MPIKLNLHNTESHNTEAYICRVAFGLSYGDRILEQDLRQEGWLAYIKARKKNPYTRKFPFLHIRGAMIDYMRKFGRKDNVHEYQANDGIAPDQTGLIDLSIQIGSMNKEDRDYIVKFIECGCSKQALAERLGVSIAAVFKKVERIVETSTSNVKRPESKRKAWNRQRDALLAAIARRRERLMVEADKYTMERIAERLGTDRTTVWRALKNSKL